MYSGRVCSSGRRSSEGATPLRGDQSEINRASDATTGTSQRTRPGDWSAHVSTSCVATVVCVSPRLLARRLNLSPPSCTGACSTFAPHETRPPRRTHTHTHRTHAYRPLTDASRLDSTRLARGCSMSGPEQCAWSSRQEGGAFFGEWDTHNTSDRRGDSTEEDTNHAHRSISVLYYLSRCFCFGYHFVCVDWR